MACIYVYKGHTFNSEIELDNFLLTNDKYYSTFGDLAFSSTTRQLDNATKLEELAKKNAKAKQEYDDLRNRGKFSRDEDGDLVIVADNINWYYTGVNKFLGDKHLKNHPDRRLYPYFNNEKFFNERYRDWAEGKFNEVEKEIFFNNDPSAIRAITTEEDRKKYKGYIETKWNTQARIGDAVHKVMELYFSTDKQGKAYRDYSETELFNAVKTALAEPTIADPQGLLLYMNYNNDFDANIKNAIEKAKAVHNDIIKKFGDDCMFFPEFAITGIGINDNNKNYNLFGIVDLLVLDKDGNFHILDYKTSIKHYGDFDDSKRAAYSYLMVTYYLMLANAGIPIQGADFNVIPLQINNFGKVDPNDREHYQYSGIEYSGLQEISNDKRTLIAFLHVEDYMPSKYSFHVTTGDTYKEVVELLASWYYKDVTSKTIDEESTKIFLEKNKVFNKRDENGKYTFSMRTAHKEMVTFNTDTKEEMILKVMEERKKLIPARHMSFMNVKKAVKEATSKGTKDVDFPKSFVNKPGATNWILNTLAPYFDGLWEVLEVPGFDDFEIIVLHNKHINLTDFIGVSTNYLHLKINKNANHTSLVGKFETDAQAELHYKRLVLEGKMGNIELMQIMLAINASLGFENTTIGNVSVINAYDAMKVLASNEELLTNFNILNKYSSVKENKYDNGKIKLASYYQLLELELANIWDLGIQDNWEDRELKAYRNNLLPAKDAIDKAKDSNSEERFKAVSKLLYDLLTKMTYGDSLTENYEGLEKLLSRKIKLYYLTLYTLAELKGIHFRQLLTDGHKWFSNILKTLTEGLSGNYSDNPGNLDSETLNLISSLVKEAYQNVRDDIQKTKPKLDKIVEKLKKDLNFGYLKENVGFNQADLYKELFITKNDNGVEDLWFKDLKDVNDVYKPILEFALDTINKNRLNRSEAELERMKLEGGHAEYLRVPIIQGGFDSKVSARGLTRAFADKLKYLNPRNWRYLFSEKIDYDNMSESERERVTNLNLKTWHELLTGPINKLLAKEEQANAKKSANLIYQMENSFEKSEEDRVKAIESIGGIQNTERNLETLILKHIFTYSLTKHVNAVFPLILAAAAHLSIQGANASQTFINDKSYLEDYIKSKIKKESIVTPELQGIAGALSKLKNAAAKFTLSFTPVQMLYLPLLGLWVDISLYWRKPDGKESFTFTHFKNAMKIVYGDLFNFSGKPTLCSLLNEHYALNDMDMNKYIDAITHNKKGFLYNFNGMAMKFSQRPDYYNRLSIFLAQMQGDGCLEAHSVVDGKLVYDWEKDKRFSKFAAAAKAGNPNSKDPEVVKQRALYYAVATLFVNEGATVEIDGEIVPFKVDMENPMPLPKAYTVKLAEGHKSLADDIYGYYTEENKSLIQATALGSMWLLFKTFWSGKKNQYLQSGGIRMRGTWEHCTEIEKDADGNLIIDEATGKPKVIEYYYDINDDGSVNYNKIVKKEELPPEKLLAPVVLWKGQWQEGILVTVARLFEGGPKNIIRNYNRLMMEDPDMARCYQSNIKQLVFDAMLFGVGGCLIGGIMARWLKELLKEHKDNEDFMTGVALAAANVAVRTVKNSFLDFNIADSLGGPLTEWTPFAISFTTNTVKNVYNTALGDLDFADMVSNSFGVTRLVKPVLDAIKPEMFRTKQEGGEWESSTAKANRERRENS